MTTDFLHGVEVVEINDGPRPISTIRSSVIGLVGTAPGAASATGATLTTGTAAANTGLLWEAVTDGAAGNDIAVFLTTPQAANTDLAVSVSGSLITVSLETGSTIGVSVSTAAEVMAAVNSDAAASLLVDVSAVGASTGAGTLSAMVKHTFLSGGTDAALPANTPVLVTGRLEAARFGTSGTIPQALDSIWDQAGAVVVVIRVEVGADAAATKTNVIGNGTTGTGVHALPLADSVVGFKPKILIAPGFTSDQAVTAELVGIAERMKAVIFADGPDSTDALAIAYRNNFGSDRLMICDPSVRVFDTATNADASVPLSSVAAGLQVKRDQEVGFWASLSNQTINGIVGTTRAIGYADGDPNSRANLLNENEISTVIRRDGWRFWGNRTTSADPQRAFLVVRRTRDMLHESVQAAQFWAIDRGITRTFVEDVVESVQSYIDNLVARGALAGGKCWADPELNDPMQIAQGHVYFNIDFGPIYPAERITFRSRLNNEYIRNIFAESA
jgi:uncharacterized protein